MFFFISVISLFITSYILNKKYDIENSESFDFSKENSIYIAIIMVIGLIIDTVVIKLLYMAIPSIIDKAYIPLLMIYLFVSIATFIIFNNKREVEIKEKREQIGIVYEALGRLIHMPKEGIDYNNIPFEIKYAGNNVNKIILTIEDSNMFKNDSVLQDAIYSLNKFFPNFAWIYSVDFQKREAEFIGQDLPPNIANFPGTDLRPAGLIPVGLSGSGEICWDLSSDKDPGSSSYVYEDGRVADLLKMPSSPQALVVGSTGGGKAIWKLQNIKIKC